MMEVGIHKMGRGYLFSIWVWDIMLYLFSCTSIDCSSPVIFLVGKIRVVWFIDPVSDCKTRRLARYPNPLGTHLRCRTLSTFQNLDMVMTDVALSSLPSAAAHINCPMRVWYCLIYSSLHSSDMSNLTLQVVAWPF